MQLKEPKVLQTRKVGLKKTIAENTDMEHQGLRRITLLDLDTHKEVRTF